MRIPWSGGQLNFHYRTVVTQRIWYLISAGFPHRIFNRLFIGLESYKLMLTLGNLVWAKCWKKRWTKCEYIEADWEMLCLERHCSIMTISTLIISYDFKDTILKQWKTNCCACISCCWGVPCCLQLLCCQRSWCFFTIETLSKTVAITIKTQKSQLLSIMDKRKEDWPGRKVFKGRTCLSSLWEILGIMPKLRYCSYVDI